MSLELSSIRQEMLGAEARYLSSINDLPEEMRASARNLVHYLALRRHDLRGLQDQLASVGLSSLARAEARTLGHVEAVLDVVVRLNGAAARIGASREDGQALLKVHTDALFGAPPHGRHTRIMVTMPDEAADDVALVQGLVEAGMDCMRVNCAHGTADAWSGMLRNLTHATRQAERPCRVLMDLAGPKLRTGTIAPGPAVVRWRPTRDVYGRVIAPARIWLTAREHPQPAPEPGAVALCVRGSWLTHLVAGDHVQLHDARGARRELTVGECAQGGAWAESTQTAYVVPGTPLSRDSRPEHGERRTYVDDLPPVPQSIDLKAGDTLILTRDLSPGHPAIVDEHGIVVQPAEIGVTLPEVFADVKPGEAVWLDDGRIGGVIREVSPERLRVTITHANTVGLKLGADKGINLPDSDLRLPPLTPKDLDDLRFIAAHADIVAYSFVRTAEDVELLQRELAALGRPDLPLVLKIETRRAFENVPSLLMAAMRSAASGVMIARGDLAVECGYERLAEIQEDMLWMAEASHTPVIWATQVLERLAKEGIPTRAEITDAAMAERAECVMLNKGPYILDAVRALDNILTRMQAHQRKKSVMLAPLGVAEGFFTPPSPLLHQVPSGG
jgi:pyruvate kinase